jgi:hypothetical protein
LEKILQLKFKPLKESKQSFEFGMQYIIYTDIGISELKEEIGR